MVTRNIECPSGLTGEIRGLKTKEANALAGQGQSRATLDQVLSACWIGTTDPGPYKMGPDGKPDWSQVLVCDRMIVMMQIRIATFGAEYAFKLQCTNSACREKFEWVLDLANDIVVQPLPEESREVFRRGNRFEVEIPGVGRKAWFKLTTGADEARAEKAVKQRRDKVMSVAMATRLIEIDGVSDVQKLAWLDELELSDANELIARMDEADGGVNTDIECECEHCGNRMEIALPFGQAFWLPPKRSKPTP